MKLFSLNMLQQALSLLFLILYYMLSLLSFSTANPIIYVQCSQLNFTPTTPYESNVNSLFTSLVDSASQYNFNKFETSPESDVVYGLFQCRGDLSFPNCKDCVVNATSQLKTTCPMSKGGEIQLEGCFVKYENTSFFGAQDKRVVGKRCGPSIGYNYDVLNRIDGALAYLVGGNGQYFRQGDLGSILGMAQCVQDLSLSDCQDCLSEASGGLRSECETSTWGDMYLGKCYIGYAEHGDFTPNKSSGGGNDDTVKWIFYVLAGVVGTGTLTLTVKSITNVNNNTNIINNNANKALAMAESAKTKADDTSNNLTKALDVAESAKTAAEDANKTAKKVAQEAKKKEEEKLRAEPFMPYHPYVPPMPPPCAYYPYPCPNPCHYQ